MKRDGLEKASRPVSLLPLLSACVESLGFFWSRLVRPAETHEEELSESARIPIFVEWSLQIKSQCRDTRFRF